VIRRDCPPSVEAYLQESGRAGRDGGQSQAVLLWGPDDERSLALAKTETGKKRISHLLKYARDTIRCRREALLNLLNYEGEKDSPDQSCCDVCDQKTSPKLREENALEDFFRRNRRSYTADEASKVLARAENLNWTVEDSGEAIDFLIREGILRKIKHQPWKNKITV
jgi:ATP-dependent DNA helicase RecQ